jgi:hypothetical protein
MWRFNFDLIFLVPDVHAIRIILPNVFNGKPINSPLQNAGTQSQTIKIPIPISLPPLFWFPFWFHGDFTHVSDDITKPIQKADSASNRPPTPR